MNQYLHTDSGHPDFAPLVRELDADLKIRDGKDHAFYAAINKAAVLHHVIIAYQQQEAAGCGAFREHAEGVAEIKRMYVRPGYRGRGMASGILNHLEAWAARSGYRKCILETGQNQPEAIALYTRQGYRRIPNFGQYEGVPYSLCFEKILE
jgi:putative acetyltransferase